jgi:hypothetical protein
MEMLQMLKFAIKQDRKGINFLSGWQSVLSELEVRTTAAEDLLSKLLDTNPSDSSHADRVDQIMRVIGEDE